MANKTPLVLGSDGLPQQLQSGDTIVAGGITLVASQATTSGTAWDFTGIPAGVNRITVMLDSVSTNGSSNYLLQLGSGSIQNTGYLCYAMQVGTTATSTSGILLTPTISATYSITGSITLVRMAGNKWMSVGFPLRNDNNNLSSWGGVTLSGNLDRLRLTTVNGTDTFDAGSWSISYE